MSVELKLFENNKDEEVTKEQYTISYLKSMLAIEQAMEPYKEQKKELRKEYMDNGWLTRQDIWSAVKALRSICHASQLLSPIRADGAGGS